MSAHVIQEIRKLQEAARGAGLTPEARAELTAKAAALGAQHNCIVVDISRKGRT